MINLNFYHYFVDHPIKQVRAYWRNAALFCVLYRCGLFMLTFFLCAQFACLSVCRSLCTALFMFSVFFLYFYEWWV